MKKSKIAQILEPVNNSGGFKGLTVTEKEIAEYEKATGNKVIIKQAAKVPADKIKRLPTIDFLRELGQMNWEL